ncbi:MAG: glycosyltransferase family 9 protein [Anaerolineae bacterium]|nr:glycosyltransferase family 9 protein [Anaerolineae bacterium]
MDDLRDEWRAVRRVLAMRLDNIGDVVMTGPALRAVKEMLPEVHLVLMVSQGAQGAAALLPWADQVLAWRALWQDMGDLPFDPAREFALIQTLQAQRFDAAIIFTSFSQTPHVASYACYLAGIPLRLGEPKSFGGATLSHAPATPTGLEAHQVDRNLRLVESVGFRTSDRSLHVTVPDESRLQAQALLAKRGLSPGSPYLLLCPWTSCPARTYTRFGSAARLLQRECGLPIVVVGAHRDAQAAASLTAELGPGAIDLVGQTTIGDLAALVAGAQLVLTNNSAPMHLADATRTPQVVLFSGTELEQQWAPRSGPARLLRRPTECQPCYRFTCPRGLACLDLPPDQVAASALELLRTGEPRRPAQPGGG